MLVVSDTSPVRALRHLGLLALLHELYGPVAIPPAVAAELAAAHRFFAPFSVADVPYLRVARPTRLDLVHELCQHLDTGEAEAIALAIELRADALLIDESDGRATATRMGLAVIGTLAVLRDAKERGHIAAARPLVERLIAEVNFFVGPALMAEFLVQVGEQPPS